MKQPRIDEPKHLSVAEVGFLKLDQTRCGQNVSAQRVELLASGVMVGDLKAETLIVAAGSRMKGQVEFGSGDKHGSKSANGHAE